MDVGIVGGDDGSGVTRPPPPPSSSLSAAVVAVTIGVSERVKFTPPSLAEVDTAAVGEGANEMLDSLSEGEEERVTTVNDDDIEGVALLPLLVSEAVPEAVSEFRVKVSVGLPPVKKEVFVSETELVSETDLVAVVPFPENVFEGVNSASTEDDAVRLLVGIDFDTDADADREGDLLPTESVFVSEAVSGLEAV